jgi:signal transduction histidine kinase
MIGARSRPSRRSILWIVTSRIIAIAVVVVLLQLAQVANDYYFDEAELAKNFIEREAATLAKGVHTHVGELQFALPEVAARYGRGERSAYAFRVLDSRGNTIGAGQASMVEQVSPWVPGAPNWPDKWLRRLDERWLHVSGGQRMRVGGHDVRIEIATRGDPDAAYWGVLAHELTEHVTLPMGPLLLTILFVTMFTVRRTLLPLASAAEQADAIDPRNPNAVLTPANMTAEIASFVAAVNRALERIRQIVQSQKMFLANVAHELRTPLSIMLLELHKIDDPRALRLQGDVRAMSRLVDQLLVLERLELVAGQDASAVDLEEVARATLARLAPWIADQGDNVELEVDSPGTFNGDRAAIADALRNLVENAVKHSPAGTTVRVSVGPGPRLCVEDSGPGLATGDVGSLMQPFQKGNPSTDGFGLGLAIVQKIADLHRGKLAPGRSALGGARFEICFEGLAGQFDAR